jgi:RNA polymerase sigma-70 factor (sigma-E family)
MRPQETVDFTRFMATRMTALHGLAVLLCQDWSRADDLLQTTMTKTFLHWSRAAAADNTDAYVRTIMVRQFVQEQRSGWYRRVRLTDRPDETAAAAIDQDSALDLQTAVAALAPRQRAVLVLRYYCDLNVDQTAHALGCTPGTVKSQTARALAALRRIIAPGCSLAPGRRDDAAPSPVGPQEVTDHA